MIKQTVKEIIQSNKKLIGGLKSSSIGEEIEKALTKFLQYNDAGGQFHSSIIAPLADKLLKGIHLDYRSLVLQIFDRAAKQNVDISAAIAALFFTGLSKRTVDLLIRIIHSNPDSRHVVAAELSLTYPDDIWYPQNEKQLINRIKKELHKYKPRRRNKKKFKGALETAFEKYLGKFLISEKDCSICKKLKYGFSIDLEQGGKIPAAFYQLNHLYPWEHDDKSYRSCPDCGAIYIYERDYDSGQGLFPSSEFIDLRKISLKSLIDDLVEKMWKAGIKDPEKELNI